MLLVTVDSGTTNTRVRVWKDNEMRACAGTNVGMRDVARNKNPDILITGIKQLLEQSLKKADTKIDQIDAIVASGMITSDLGLCHIPHLIAPVTLEQLAEGAKSQLIPEIAPLPIWFIPGIKNAIGNVSLENCDAMDMMRGEEVEVFGLLEQCPEVGPALIVLPGSHSKLVKLDEKQRITGCATTMAGEVLDIFTHQTVLAQSLQNGFVEVIDDDYLFQGAKACSQIGITRAAFIVRILDSFTQASDDQRASFLLGAVLYADITTMKHSIALHLTSETTIVISGKSILKGALAKLIKRDPFFTGKVIMVSEKSNRPLSGTGALAVLQLIQNQHPHIQIEH